jgi:hypothetical protein
MSDMDSNQTIPSEPLHGVSVTIVHIGRSVYNIIFWIALTVQVLFSVITWRYTITYEYFCGNPLMSEWALWFVITFAVGLLLLPGGLWSFKHRNKRIGVILAIGFLLYLLSMILMLISGVVFGTVPEFFNFIPYTFY